MEGISEVVFYAYLEEALTLLVLWSPLQGESFSYMSARWSYAADVTQHMMLRYFLYDA